MSIATTLLISLAVAVGAKFPDNNVSVSMAKTDHRDVSIEMVHGCVVFEASVNGRKTWVLLDNAAERSIIDIPLATDIGLKTRSQPGSIITIGGSVPKVVFDDVELNIPGQFSTHEPMYGIDLTAVSARFGRKIGVIIGHDLLSLLAVGINAKTHSLFFIPGGVVVTGANASTLSVLSLERVADSELATVQIDGKEARLRVDLGYGESVELSPASLREIQPATDNETSGHLVGADGRASSVTETTLTNLVIGSFKYKNVKAQISKGVFKEGDGLLGAGALLRQQLLLDIEIAGYTCVRSEYMHQSSV